MGEPLKDKRLLVHIGDKIIQNNEEYDCIKEVSYFSEKDLKSAVEWLKEQFSTLLPPDNKTLCKITDQAFPDLKEKKAGTTILSVERVDDKMVNKAVLGKQ